MIRRVITGHVDGDVARAVIDGDVTNIKHGASGSTVFHIWNTRETPAGIATGPFADAGLEPHVVPPPANGSRFAVIDFPPGNTGVMHRTESLDYVVILSGEIDMDMDDSTVHMKAGDVMVQRGTNHAWCNRGTEPARIAFVLIDATPLGFGHPRLT